MQKLHSDTGAPLIQVRGLAQIDLARAMLVSLARQHGCERIVFIDHDMIFTTSDVLKLVNECQDYPLIGAPYAQRKEGGKVVGSPILSEASRMHIIGAKDTPDILQAAWLGMGLTAVHMCVFNALDATLPGCWHGGLQLKPYFLPIVDGGLYYSEDISFCRRAAAVGFKPWIDMSVRPGHKGEYVYRLGWPE
ncbi:MAG TPA: hypothetical protein VHL05_12470 [Terriglobales bacterium]|jgi:hypothetical protein|nr:hypothetical protein [Terriglobales bacterium]